MADRRASSFVQHPPPSLAPASSSSSTSASTHLRPAARRSVSGSVNTGAVPSFTPADSRVANRSPLAPQRSATTMSKIDQDAWTEPTGTASSGSPSSVWNVRPPSTMDGDAVTTASASNVTTPGRSATALDAKDATSNAAIFTPSPLLPQEGSAWSIGRPGSLTWGNDLATRSNTSEIITESAASSPSAVKRNTTKDTTAITNDSSPSSTFKDAASAANEDARASVSPSNSKKTAAPVPKRAPIRSATLDPKHLAANRRPSSNSDDELASGQTAAADDEQLVDGVSSLTITTVDAAPPQQGCNSPPAFMGPAQYAPRASAPFPPPPFSPGEAFMNPSPYLPGSGARSPDGYTHAFPGVANMMSGMAPIDMSGYESYRTTPDPYAPTMPGRAIFASPGSQGSTPQSPSFGPAPLGPHFNPAMRTNGETLFYPGIVPGFGPPPTMAGGMASPVRPGMTAGPGQYGFGPGPGAVDARGSQLAQSPMMAPGMPIPMGAMMMPPTSPAMSASQMTPGGPDSRSSPSLSQSSPYQPGPHRRMGSSGPEPFIPGMAMSPRPPFGMTGQAGPFVPGQASLHGMMGAAPMHASMMPWNGRFHDHRRVPTGPGGVMAPVGGYAMAGGPMDPHYGRNGAEFYGGAPFHPSGGNGVAGPSSSNGGGGPNSHARSPLLEDFRSRHAKNRKFELVDIYGSVVEFSGDQHGSRFIQEKLDTASAEDKKALFDEVLPHARQLMTDVFGNYVIQKMLEHGDEEQRDVLAREMEGHILTLSLGTYGCRVVQKAFDHISAVQREKLAKELDGHIMQCVRDQNANHVVQKVIERVDADKIDFIPRTFVGHVAGLAGHCYSCRVLQRTFEYCKKDQTRVLLDELLGEAVELMQHQYGNYVVQWILQRGEEVDRREVVGRIKGKVLMLSRHKFASNVVEEVVRTSEGTDRVELLEEILRPISSPGEGKEQIVPAVLMMKDQFANYVLQRFFEMADREQRGRLVEVLQPALVGARRASNGSGGVGGGGVAAHTAKHLVAIERLIEGYQADAKE